MPISADKKKSSHPERKTKARALHRIAESGVEPAGQPSQTRYLSTGSRQMQCRAVRKKGVGIPLPTGPGGCFAQKDPDPFFADNLQCHTTRNPWKTGPIRTPASPFVCPNW